MSAAGEEVLRELAGQLPAVVEGLRFDAPPAATLNRAVYIDCRFEGVHWQRCRFEEVRFVNCRFEANRFERCVWRELGCADSEFIDCVWDECELERVGWQRVSASRAQWRGGRQRDFSCVELDAADWRLSDVRSAHGSFVDCRLREWQLQGGRWSDSAWIRNQLDGFSVEGAELRNFIHGQSRARRVALSACRGLNARWIDCELEHMALDHCELRQAAWSHSVWNGGAIRASRLAGASFDQARLRRVQAREADLEQALFDGARLEDCAFEQLSAPRLSLRQARLEQVNLSGANLRGLDASGAALQSVKLSGCDCRGGRLIGQPRGAWSAADTAGALFDDSKLEQDRAWRQQAQPGPRGAA
ncbi:hypothetical protein DB032_14215 [Chromobacterium sp. Panama]|uniref:pentapeptide repeat-containing protein n=1 Tax=Chromobacterium sp. Panama TaxID=2161826 RepID=UPI000D305B2C|nr:pentapeptide repeat-containing protein [Chromobacterium sp. Panama]PTU65997.1 hypothetical protein DB032_14215 [Chromobacterium sp. Panama]